MLNFLAGDLKLFILLRLALFSLLNLHPFDSSGGLWGNLFDRIPFLCLPLYKSQNKKGLALTVLLD